MDTEFGQSAEQRWPWLRGISHAQTDLQGSGRPGAPANAAVSGPPRSRRSCLCAPAPRRPGSLFGHPVRCLCPQEPGLAAVCGLGCLSCSRTVPAAPVPMTTVEHEGHPPLSFPLRRTAINLGGLPQASWSSWHPSSFVKSLRCQRTPRLPASPRNPLPEGGCIGPLRGCVRGRVCVRPPPGGTKLLRGSEASGTLGVLQVQPPVTSGLSESSPRV